LLLRQAQPTLPYGGTINDREMRMNNLTTALGVIFALTVAGPASAASPSAIKAPSGIQLVQKSDERDKKPVTSGGQGSKAAMSKEAEREKARANKQGDMRGKDRAGEVQEMNKAKKAQ
jgi:hypothetical protein